MKKRLLTTLVILVFAVGAFAADGPIDKGSMMLGGNVYFESQSGDLYKNADGDSPSMFFASPSFGYFIAPSIMIGAMIGFESYSIGDGGFTEFAFGPMAGYFFNLDASRTEAKGGIYPYIKGFFLFDTFKIKDVDGSDNTTTFGGEAGINYFLSNSVALDFGLGFKSDSYKPDGADESVSGTSIQIGIGIDAFIF